MKKIKKIPKDFVVCDGMTSEMDLISGLLTSIGIISGIGFSFWLLWNWKRVLKFFKGSQ